MSIDKSFQQSLNKPISQQLKHFNAQVIAQSQSSSLLSSPFFGGEIKQQPKKQSLSRPITLNKRTIKKEVLRQIQQWTSSKFFATQFQIQNVQSSYFSTIYELMGEIYEILLNKFVQMLKQKQRQFEQQPIKQYIQKVEYVILIIKRTQLNINPDETFENLYSNIVCSVKIIADCLHSQQVNKNNKSEILINTLISGTKAEIALEIKGKLAMLADQTFYYKNKSNIESESNLQASLYKQHDQDSNFSIYSDKSFSQSLAKQKRIKKSCSDTKLKRLLSRNHISLMKKRLNKIKNVQIKNLLVQNLLQSYNIKQQDLQLIENEEKQAKKASFTLNQSLKPQSKSDPIFKKNSKDFGCLLKLQLTQSLTEQPSIKIVQGRMKIGIFTKQWPRHNFNGHLQKTINLIQSLINLNHDLVICSDDPETKNKEQIKQFPLQTLQINPKKISTSLSGFTGLKFKPNLFIFDSFQTEDKYSAFVYNRWNKCSRVLAINELNGLSKWRKNNYKLIPNVLVPSGALLSPEKSQQIFTLQQLRSIHRSDYIFTGNEYLYHLIGKHIYPNVKNKTKYVSHVGHAYPLEQYYDQTLNLRYRPFRNRKNFIFLGNMQNQSNRDCIFLLANAIWPLIRAKIPEAQLHIYGQAGAYYQNLFKNLSSHQSLSKPKLRNIGIHFKGVLPKEEQFLAEYKALLYPCTFTTGPHIKILQSWFMHLPVVTTPIGAQGLFYQSYDPQFSTNIQGHSNLQFSSERVYTKQQNEQAQKIKNYYDNNIISPKSIKNLTYGGSYENFTYKDFVQSAVKIYTDEQYWNICLKNAHKIIKKNNNDMHLQVVLKKALVNVQIASYQGRSRPSYEQQWKRYTKSEQFNKKIRN